MPSLGRKVFYRVIFEEYMAPLILDKEKKGDDTDDHGAGDEDDDDEATVYHYSEITKIYCFQKVILHWPAFTD